jgi:hypothetical protein
MRLFWALSILCIFILASNIVIAQNDNLSGEPVAGTLTENELSQEYTFDGVMGDVVSVTLVSRMFDAYLTLQDAEGSELASNDDTGGSLDAAIENFTLPDDDTYTVIVTSADGTSIGDYILTLSYRSVGTIAYGDVVQDEITENIPTKRYRFEGEEGDVILISMASAEFDTYLTLSDSDTDLFSDDDGGDGTNSLIIGYTLPATDTYFITARGYSPFSFGQFTLQVSPVETMTLEANTTIETEVHGDVVMYSFPATVGDRIEVDIVGHDGLDTALTLNDPNGYAVYSDDDSGEDLNPEVHDRLIEESGTYTLIVQPVDSNAVGSYDLTLTINKPKPIECGETYPVSFTSKQQIETFIFEIQDMGFEVRFTGDETPVSNLSVRIFRDEVFLSTQTNTVDEYNFSVSANFEGQSSIRLLLTDYSYRVNEFTLELVCQ